MSHHYRHQRAPRGLVERRPALHLSFIGTKASTQQQWRGDHTAWRKTIGCSGSGERQSQGTCTRPLVYEVFQLLYTVRVSDMLYIEFETWNLKDSQRTSWSWHDSMVEFASHLADTSSTDEPPSDDASFRDHGALSLLHRRVTLTALPVNYRVFFSSSSVCCGTAHSFYEEKEGFLRRGRAFFSSSDINGIIIQEQFLKLVFYEHSRTHYDSFSLHQGAGVVVSWTYHRLAWTRARESQSKIEKGWREGGVVESGDTEAKQKGR